MYDGTSQVEGWGVATRFTRLPTTLAYIRSYILDWRWYKHSATQCQVVTVVPCVLICLPPEPLPSPSGVSADPLEYPRSTGDTRGTRQRPIVLLPSIVQRSGTPTTPNCSRCSTYPLLSPYCPAYCLYLPHFHRPLHSFIYTFFLLAILSFSILLLSLLSPLIILWIILF